MAIVTTGLLAGAAISGGALLVDRLALATIRPTRKAVYDTAPEDIPFHRRPVEFRSGGATLRGWLFECEQTEPRALAVLVHGWSANSGTILRLAGPLLGAGYPVLAFDVRGHGSSDPAPFVTIRHYRDDVMAALRFAETALSFPRRVAIGHSMGGAAVALAAARGAPLDGIGLVAAPADIMEVTSGYLSDRGLPGPLAVRLCTPSWRLRAAESFTRLRPDHGLSSVRVPVRVVQGLSDRRVKPDHARRLSRAAGVAAVEVAGHGHTDVLESPEAHRAILDLMALSEGGNPTLRRTGSPGTIWPRTSDPGGR